MLESGMERERKRERGSRVCARCETCGKMKADGTKMLCG